MRRRTSCSSRATTGEIYNIGAGNETHQPRARRPAARADRAATRSFIKPVDDRLGHDRRYSVNIDKITRPRLDAAARRFDEALAETVDWYRDNRDWWEPLKARAGLLMRVLVTGAGGQLGHDVVAQLRGGRRRRRRRSTTPRSTSPTATPCSGAIRRRPARRRHQLRGVDRRRRLRDRTRARAVRDQRRRGAATSPRRADGSAPTSCTSAPTTCSTARSIARTRVGRAEPAVRVRPSKLAGEREAPGSRRAPSCARRGCAASTATTWSRRPAPAPPSSRTLAFVDDQRGCPTFTADLAPVLRRLALDRRSGVFHVTNQGAVTLVRVRAGDPAAASGIRPDDGRARSRTADLDPPRPAPRPANSVLDNARWRAAGMPRCATSASRSRTRRRADVRLRRCPPRSSRPSGWRTPWNRVGIPFPGARRSRRCASGGSLGRCRIRSSCTTSPAAIPKRRNCRTARMVRSPCSRWRGRGCTSPGRGCAGRRWSRSPARSTSSMPPDSCRRRPDRRSSSRCTTSRSSTIPSSTPATARA